MIFNPFKIAIFGQTLTLPRRALTGLYNIARRAWEIAHPEEVSPTREDTVYGPVNHLEYAQDGRVDVVLKGQTVTNLLNYNPQTWEEWEMRDGVSVDDGCLKMERYQGMSAPADGNASYLVEFKPTTKYGFLIDVVDTTTEGSNVILQGANNSVFGSYSQYLPSPEIGYNKRVLTSEEGWDVGDFRLRLAHNGTSITLRSIQIYELTPGSEMEQDFENMSADELAVKYTFITGTQHTAPCEVKSVGKNLFDGEFELGSLGLTTGSELSHESRIRSKNFIKVSPGKAYTLSSPDTPFAAYPVSYDQNKNYISQGFNINAHYVRFRVDDTTNLETKAQIEPGSVATPYEPYRHAEAKSPVTLRSLPNGVRDEYDVITGELTKRVSDDYVLQEEDIQGYLVRSEKNQLYTISLLDMLGNASPSTTPNIEGKVAIHGLSEKNHTTIGEATPNTFGVHGTNQYIYFDFPLETTEEEAKNIIVGLTLTYQLAEPVTEHHDPEITYMGEPYPYLRAFKDGTLYVEPDSEPGETTYPAVEAAYTSNTDLHLLDPQKLINDVDGSFVTLGSTPARNVNSPIWTGNSLKFMGMQYIPVPVPFDVNGDWTVFLVGKRDGGQESIEVLFGIHSYLVRIYRGTTSRFALGTSPWAESNYIELPEALTGFRLLVAKKSGTTLTLKDMESGAIAYNTATDIPTAGSECHLGRDLNGNYLNGEIAFYMPYVRATTEAEDRRIYRRVKAMLARKGIEI